MGKTHFIMLITSIISHKAQLNSWQKHQNKISFILSVNIHTFIFIYLHQLILEHPIDAMVMT